MVTHLHRSIDNPIREGLSWDDLWRGSDRGLICCWERGRQKRIEEPELAARAERGELVRLAWKGGVEEEEPKKEEKSHCDEDPLSHKGVRKKAIKNKKKAGTLNYLATWQGLRGEDLDITLEDKRSIVCTKTGKTVVFSAKLPKDEE